MNIAIFTNNYLPNPYGVTVSVESFRREFEKRGHTVYVFAPHFPEYKDTNAKVWRYPSIDINFKFRFPLPIPYSWRMSRILKKLKIDIIHSQHPNLLGTSAFYWARKKNIPLIFTWHTLYDHYAHFARVLPQKWAGNWIIKKAVNYANQADALVVPTDSIISILKKWGVRNRNIIPVATGVDEKELEEADKNVVRGKYKILPDETVLLLVSRLTQEKNVEFIFRALRSILKNISADALVVRKSEQGGQFARQSTRKIKFLVAGDGDLLPKMKKYCADEKISEAVIFAGLVPHKELKNYYAGADIFVYASKSETQGMIISEAMYMGLPIVAVKATGISSLMLNRANGFLVEENEKEFSEAVLKLISDIELRKRFGEASGKIARENFTSEVCAKKMLEVYQMAINVKAK